jgi:hypothetical protein
MSLYSKEIRIQVPKERIIDLVTDPFLMSGVFSHNSILKVYDQKQKKYVDFSSFSGFSNKFLVVYIFGTPDTKINLIEGEMEGALFDQTGITYRGWSKDQKFTWEITFEVRAINLKETLVRILTNATYKVSSLDKLLGRSPFALMQHIVEDHITPYFKYYLKPGINIDEIKPIRLSEENGIFSQISPKITEISEKVEYGVAMIKGLNLSGKMLIKNGKISTIRIKYDKETLEGQEALLKLLTLTTLVEITFYTFNLDEIILSKLEECTLINQD